jgi:cell division protein FtsZ
MPLPRSRVAEPVAQEPAAGSPRAEPRAAAAQPARRRPSIQPDAPAAPMEPRPRRPSGDARRSRSRAGPGRAESLPALRAIPPRRAVAEALSRLQRAVQNIPGRGRPAGPASPPREPERQARLTINSLIHRMTGQVTREEPAVRARSRARSPPRVTRPSEPVLDDAERDRVEIPAFLRRQAN